MYLARKTRGVLTRKFLRNAVTNASAVSSSVVESPPPRRLSTHKVLILQAWTANRRFHSRTSSLAMESRMGVGNLSNGSFPKKLFTLLHEEDSTIIGFLHGKYFKILDAARFASEVLPKYYRHQKVESFQRQLNMYGFRRISRGDMSGAYYHPMLRQDREDLVPYIGKDILQDRNKQQELIAFGTERFKSKRTRASMTSVESSISSAGSVISLPNETTSEPKPLVADVKIETGDQNSSEDRGVINAPGATESDFDSIFGFCDSPNDLKGADCREQDYKEEIEPKLENKKRKNVVDLDERLTRLL